MSTRFDIIFIYNNVVYITRAIYLISAYPIIIKMRGDVYMKRILYYIKEILKSIFLIYVLKIIYFLLQKEV